MDTQMKKFLSLPFVRDAVAENDRNEDERALAARAAVLDQLDTATANLTDLKASLAAATARLEMATAEAHAAGKTVREIEFRLTQANTTHHQAYRTLLEHGERCLLDAEGRISTEVSALERQLPRMDADSYRDEDVFGGPVRPGFPIKRVQQHGVIAKAESMRNRLADLRTAHEKISSLRFSRMTPRALEAQTNEIMGHLYPAVAEDDRPWLKGDPKHDRPWLAA